MEIVTPITSLQTAAAVIGIRPTTLISEGVDLAAWKLGAYSQATIMAYLKSDGSAEAVGSPVGGALGVEVWTYKADLAGTSRWFLAGFLNNGQNVPIIAGGGAMFELRLLGIGSRLALAGAAVGIHPPSYYFEPISIEGR